MAEMNLQQFSGVGPQSMSLEDFAAGTPEKGPAVLDRALLSAKRMGGEAAAIADLVLSMPGFTLGVGAQLGGTLYGFGAQTHKDPTHPVSPFAVGREAAHLVEPVMNPLLKLMQAFKSGEAYEQSLTSKGMNKLAQ